MTTLSASLAAAFLNTSYAWSIWSKCERVGAHLLRRDPPAGHHLHQGRDGDGVDQPHREGHVLDPHVLHGQLDRDPVHTDVGDGAAGADQRGCGEQGLGEADGLDRNVHTEAVGQAQYVGGGTGPGLDRVGGAELQGLGETELVGVDRDDPRGAPEAGGKDRAESDRARADDGYGVARADSAGQDADFVARGQRVGQEDGLFVGDAFGYRIERGVGVGYAHQLSLGAVDEVSEDPADAADGVAVRGHPALAVLAATAFGDGGDQDAVADGEPAHGVA